MTRSAMSTLLVCAAVLAAPSTAHASDEAFEFWLNPSVDYDIDDENTLELETAQRFRSESDGRVDTYFVRAWLHHRVNDTFTLSGAVEQRENDGGLDEVRTLQQVSGQHGYFRTRLRLEQRWIEDQSRMGLRLRPRLGVEVPLDEAGRWSFHTDTELFFALRSALDGPADDARLNGMRSQFGVTYAASDNLELSVTYLRQQDFIEGAPDSVGNAPLIGIAFSF